MELRRACNANFFCFLFVALNQYFFINFVVLYLCSLS